MQIVRLCVCVCVCVILEVVTILPVHVENEAIASCLAIYQV